MTIAGLILAAFFTPPVVGDSINDKTDIYAPLLQNFGVRDEPSVIESCSNGYEAIRFIEFSDGDSLNLIRLERSRDHIDFTQREFSNIRESASATRAVSEQQWAAIITELQVAGFWGIERDRTAWLPDTVTWIFETCIAGRYHNARFYPDHNLAMQFAVAKLAGLKH